MRMHEPRWYQCDVIDRARACARSGLRRLCIQAPTGSGKGDIAAFLIRSALERGKRALFLAHMRSLVVQQAHRLITLDLPAAVLMAGYDSRLTCPVQVASRDTLLSRSLRSEDLDLPPADLVIVDECVAGGTLIETEHGQIPIRDLPAFRSGYVSTYNGVHPCWRRITAFVPKGVRPVIDVTLS